MLALVTASKDDFSSETSASTSSIDALASAVKALSSNASTAQIAAIVATASVHSAVRSCSDAGSLSAAGFADV